MEESQRRVSAEANTADKFGYFNRLQPACPRLCCYGATAVRLSRLPNSTYAQTSRSQQDGSSTQTGRKTRLSREHYCSDDFILTR
jgi:hypothetical protein